MALQGVFDINSGTGLRINLGGTDDLFVGENGVIHSSDDDGVFATGSSQTVTLLGSIVTDGASVFMGDDADVDHHHTLHIGASGSIYSAASAGILLLGRSSSFINEGSVAGSLIGVTWYAGTTSSTSTIENFGSIAARTTGMSLHAGSTEHIDVTNTGLIEGGLYAILVSSTGGSALIENSGQIRGIVALGGGDDIFRNEANGTLSSYVSAGAGDDQLFGNATAEEFRGGDGEDTMRGGSGNDSLDGGSGDDDLFGDRGRDTLIGGGDDDTFHFRKGDSATKANKRDTITDFDDAGNDTLDFSGFAGKLKYKGKADLTGKNQVHIEKKGKHVLVEISTDKDSAPEFAVLLKNTKMSDMAANDFIL